MTTDDAVLALEQHGMVAQAVDPCSSFGEVARIHALADCVDGSPIPVYRWASAILNVAGIWHVEVPPHVTAGSIELHVSSLEEAVELVLHLAALRRDHDGLTTDDSWHLTRLHYEAWRGRFRTNS